MRGDALAELSLGGMVGLESNDLPAVNISFRNDCQYIVLLQAVYPTISSHSPLAGERRHELAIGVITTSHSLDH